MSTPKLGDVVRTKAGGPKMTVDFVSDDGVGVKAIWFDSTNALHRASFNSYTLVIVPIHNAVSGNL